MDYADIAAAFGLSHEWARKTCIRALFKVRAAAPWLADVLESLDRIRDRRSPAQMMIDAGDHEYGDYGDRRAGR